MESYALTAGVVVALALSVAVVWLVERPGRRWVGALRARFLYGIPWGTLVSVGLVLAVYLFVQGGWTDWNNPVTLPFRAWSYLYPTGIVAAGFAHNSSSHLIGNLTATIVLAPIAEYFWGHYPPERDRGRSLAEVPFGDVLPTRAVATTDGWRTNPYIRAFVIFPSAVVVVGLLTGIFALGPVIGFSGVVFAFGGFAIVRYPITTVVGLLVASVVRTFYAALTDPIVVATVAPSPPSPPTWATTAVQGHALGLLIGLSIGLALLWHRNRRPNPARLFLAMLIYATTRGLWAVYWFQGEDTYVLYRGIGVVLVALLALLVVLAAAAPKREFPRLSRLSEGVVTARTLAFVVILLGTAAISGPAVVANLATVEDGGVPGDGEVIIEDYAVTYEENVHNQMIPVIDLPGLREATDLRTSGVIVVSERRHIWTRAVSRARLADTGQARVQIGGVGWRETVTATRSGWRVAGNSTVYAVDLRVDEGDSVRSFESDPSRAEPRLSDHNVTVAVDDGEFSLRVTHDDEYVGTTPIPKVGNATTVGDLRLSTEEIDNRTAVFAEYDETRVRIAQKEEY